MAIIKDNSLIIIYDEHEWLILINEDRREILIDHYLDVITQMLGLWGCALSIINSYKRKLEIKEFQEYGWTGDWE